MSPYLTRAAARSYLRDERGIPIGNAALENMASDGIGPKYALIAGRALYTREWLDAWVAEQAAKPVVRRRGAAQREQSAA